MILIPTQPVQKHTAKIDLKVRPLQIHHSIYLHVLHSILLNICHFLSFVLSGIIVGRVVFVPCARSAHIDSNEKSLE